MNDHKVWFGIYSRAGFLTGIIITLLMFLLIPYAEPDPYHIRAETVTQVELISATMYKGSLTPPPPERPKIAQAVEVGTDITQNIETISSTELNENLIQSGGLNLGPEIEVLPFYKVEVKPEPVYIPPLEYPDLAKKANVEGNVVVRMLVDIDGTVAEAQILKSSGNQNLDEAALGSARKWRFTPGRQRDKLVRVWVHTPFVFDLKDAD